MGLRIGRWSPLLTNHPAQDVRWPSDLKKLRSSSRLYLRVSPVVSEQELNSARGLREAIYRCACAVRRLQKPRIEDVDTVNRWAACSTLVPELSENGRSAQWKNERGISPVLAMIARDAIDLFTRTSPPRIKLCADPTCRGLFVDESRPGRRRWCAMDMCGNRSKSRTFARRHRSSVG